MNGIRVLSEEEGAGLQSMNDERSKKDCSDHAPGNAQCNEGDEGSPHGRVVGGLRCDDSFFAPLSEILRIP